MNLKLNRKLSYVVLSTILAAGGLSTSCSPNKSKSEASAISLPSLAFPAFKGVISADDGYTTISIEQPDSTHFKLEWKNGRGTSTRILNLTDGAIDETDFKSKKTAFTTKDPSYLKYRDALNSFVVRLQWLGENSSDAANKKQVDAVLSYVRQRLAQGDAQAPDEIAFVRSETLPDNYVYTNIEYFSKVATELLWEVLDSDGKVIGSDSEMIFAGQGYTMKTIKITKVPDNKKITTRVSILKAGSAKPSVQAQTATKVN